MAQASIKPVLHTGKVYVECTNEHIVYAIVCTVESSTGNDYNFGHMGAVF